MVVPDRLARWAVTLTLTVPDGPYDVGDPVPFTVTIHNRLPVPVSVATPRLRLWAWAVDGQVEATDEATFASDTEGELTLDGRETKRLVREWNGRFERTGAGPNGRSEWVLADPGVHELSAFVATEPPCASDSATFELRRE